MTFSERDQREFREAAGLHQAGNFPAAIRAYEKLLKRLPRQPIVLNLLGLAEFQSGQFEAAAGNLSKALALDPAIPDIHYNLATVLQRLGRFAESIPHFEKALKAKPNDADARNNFGTALRALGRIEDALREYRQALAINPDHAGVHLNLGNVLSAQKMEKEGIAHIEKSIALQPRNPEAYISLGKVLAAQNRNDDALAAFDKAIAINPNYAESYFSRGLLLSELEKHDEAAGHFLQATKLKPDFADAYIELGNSLQRINRHEDSLQYYHKAIELKPDRAIAHYNLGNALQQLERYDESVPVFETALKIDPKFSSALINLGNSYFSQKRYDEAEKCFDESLKLNENDPSAHLGIVNLDLLFDREESALRHLRRAMEIDSKHEAFQSWNLGYHCLRLGLWDIGWNLHENRFKKVSKPILYRHYSAPRWGGEKVRGSLLAWAEQGIGDHILWASILPDVSAFADELIVECDPRLVPLFERSFDQMPNMKILPQSPEQEKLYEGKIDAHTPFASTGKFLRQNWDAFPKRERGYLRADVERTKKLREKITADSKFAVGLSWRSGNPYYGADKTAELRDFKSIFQIKDCRFVDLQYGETREDREKVKAELGVSVSPVDEIDNTNDIDGLAALIEACDAVVTTSNSTVHLAGALGKDTWLLVPHGRGRIWYWFNDRLDSPWYPKLRLVRQAKDESWASVAARAASELSAFLARR